MENEAGNRRLNVIAAHFASAGGDFAATHVHPENCSSYSNSVIRSCHNRVNFARQCSDSHAPFMRQALVEEGNSTWSTVPPKSTICAPQPSFEASEGKGPMFSRPTTEPTIPNVGIEKSLVHNFNPFASESPLFARASCGGISEQNQFISETKPPSSGSNVIGWSPRMDVAESGRNYVITVEIPGVKISDIRVEIDDRKLTVTGKRFNQYNEVSGFECSDNSISSYHKREIVQGPYQLVWPLPININKDGVLADFWDGLLRIVLPKL